MEFDEIDVKVNPGICRCCLSEGCYKELSSEYSWMTETEVYADMLLDCFDISISQHNEGPNGAQRLICEVCITRLRDACNFKKQVLESEKKFVDMLSRGDFRPKVMVFEDSMKEEKHDEDIGVINEVEVEYLDEDMDYVDDTEYLQTETDIDQPSVSKDTTSKLQMKVKRGRPRKSPELKPEKKIKVTKTKVEEKIKKSAVKEFAIFDTSRYERNWKDDLTDVLITILQHSTVMPFRWYGNKYMCFFCWTSFIESSKLKSHTKKEHRDTILSSEVLRSFIKSSSIKLDISNSSCRKCPQSVRGIEDFFTHLSERHDIKCVNWPTQNIYAFKLSDNGMMCIECGLKFRFFGPLLAHVHKYHGKTNTYLCEICGQGFIGKTYIDSHIKNVHPNNVTYQCDTCDKKFNSQYLLSNHNNKVHHTGKLKCPKCPEVLGSRYLRTKHLALFHDLKNAQFRCDKCPKIFTFYNNLLQHVHRVHLKEKTITCEICGFKVFNKASLRRHMVKHDDARPHQCDFCQKSFQRKKTLNLHRRIHTNDRQYVCKECGKAFIQVSGLKLHMRVHHPVNEGIS